MRGPGVGTSQVPSGDTDALVALVPSTCWMPNSQTPQGGVEHVPIPVKLKNNTFCSPADMLLKTKPLSCWTNTNDDIYFKICKFLKMQEQREGFFFFLFVFFEVVIRNMAVTESDLLQGEPRSK